MLSLHTVPMTLNNDSLGIEFGHAASAATVVPVPSHALLGTSDSISTMPPPMVADDDDGAKRDDVQGGDGDGDGDVEGDGRHNDNDNACNALGTTRPPLDPARDRMEVH